MGRVLIGLAGAEGVSRHPHSHAPPLHLQRLEVLFSFSPQKEGSFQVFKEILPNHGPLHSKTRHFCGHTRGIQT